MVEEIFGEQLTLAAGFFVAELFAPPE